VIHYFLYSSKTELQDLHSSSLPLHVAHIQKRTLWPERQHFPAWNSVYLRYFNTFGLGENSKGAYSSVIHKFIEDLKIGNTPIIFGDGTQRRDFIYVKDSAKASVLAMENGKSGEAYNIGTGFTTDFNAIYKIIKEEMHSNAEPKYETIPFSTYQMFTQANIEKARNDLGFSPEYDIKSGIKEMLSL
jgi:Nucleoside-diphosphate-sugar epimerases